MCRLLAMGNNNLSRGMIKSIFSVGLRELSFEGNFSNIDGTGVGQASTRMAKSGDKASLFVYNKDFEWALDGFDISKPMIGHVRSASTKLVNKNESSYPKEDAQPMIGEHIVLVHNGTVTNHQELKKEHGIEGDGTDTWVISQLFDSIFQMDLESFNRVSEKLEGTFALMIQDGRDPNKIFITRHEKPLFHYKSDTDIHLICTSKNLAYPLEVIRTTSRYLSGDSPWDRWEIKEIPENKLLSFTNQGLEELGEIRWKKTPIVIHQPWKRQLFGSQDVSRKKAEILSRIFKSLDLDPSELRKIYQEVFEIPNSAFMIEDNCNLLVEFLEWVSDDKDRLKELEEFLGRKICNGKILSAKNR